MARPLLLRWGMKKHITPILLSSIIISGTAQAGEVMTEAPVIAPEPTLPEYINFSLNARLRYESRIIQGLDHSDALTLRVRPGFTILPDSKLNFFFETEHTLALVEDFQVGTPQSANFEPFRANNAPIADPETNEINQAYIQYKDGGFTAKAGRQRIILDNAAFIGNVGWRQNEQTYDAISLSYKTDTYSLYYAYAQQANRIFGSDATDAVRELEGDMHFINASAKINDAKLGAYAYLLDFTDGVSFPGANSNTYGLQLDYNGLHAEYAYQTDAADGQADYDASYAHLFYKKKVGGVTYKAGVEYLEDGFVTPLATVHAFNGFADTFIANRLGLVNTWEGLTDIYGMAATKVGGVTVKGFLHYYMDDSLSDAYGWEADLVLVKKLTDNLTLLGKSSYYVGDEDNGFANDIIQTSVELGYKF